MENRPDLPRQGFQKKPLAITPDPDIEVMRDEMSRLKRYGNIDVSDFDKLLQTAESQMPYYDSERLYLYELDRQQKIWVMFLVISIFMLSLSALLTFN